MERAGQRRFVVNTLMPCTAFTSLRSVPTNPTWARTRREAVFQSQTVAETRSKPDDLAQSSTAHEASVA